MAHEVMVNPSFVSVKDQCKNQHELCSLWSLVGECDNNPAYMKVNCAPACQSCDQLSYTKRCPFDPTKAKNAFDIGDVNKFFERIVADEEFAKHISVHSRPKRPEDDESFQGGPWLITYDDFISVSFILCNPCCRTLL